MEKRGRGKGIGAEGGVDFIEKNGGDDGKLNELTKKNLRGSD